MQSNQCTAALRDNLSKAINIFRQLYSNNRKVLNMINEDYEEVLLAELNLIPKDVVVHILSYITVINIFIDSFDLAKFTAGVEALPSSMFPHFSIDSYDLFCKGLDKLALSDKDKARIKNMTSKFKPLFVCLNGIIENPVGKLVILNNIFSNAYDNLL